MMKELEKAGKGNKSNRTGACTHETGIETMTSLQIAEITGKRHTHVLDAIRNMEPDWVKVAGPKFRLSKYTDSTGRELPMYELSKTECLYVATKFNNEARAKLVLRWEKLESAGLSIVREEIREIVREIVREEIRGTGFQLSEASPFETCKGELCIRTRWLLDTGIINRSSLYRRRIKTVRRGGNGRYALVLYASIPTYIKDRIIDLLK